MVFGMYFYYNNFSVEVLIISIIVYKSGFKYNFVDYYF